MEETSTEVPMQPKAVRAQLNRVLKSPLFRRSPRAREFLRYVVEETLKGRGDRLDQVSIGIRALGRGEDFYPSEDPIVRMQAGRVRRALEAYYRDQGAGDSILIELPKGSYEPAFEVRESAPGAAHPANDPDSWPSLLVSPLRKLTDRKDVEFIAQGLASDLAAELSREKTIQVFLAPDAKPEPEHTCRARFELSGTLGLRGDDLKVNFHLVDRETGRQTWAETFFCPAGPEQSVGLARAVQTAVATITEERGVVSSQLAGESRRRPNAVGIAYEAILRHHHFEATHEPEAFTEALTALRQAVATDSDCALCWSYLGRLGGAHWGLDLPGETIPIEESIAAARRGAEIAPLDVRCRSVLGYLLLLGGDIDQARSEAEAALQLGRGSIFWLDAIGYLLTLSGDWERGPAMIRRAIQVNPFPRRACHCGLWLDAVRRNDPGAMLAAATEYIPEAHFWGPLMKAVALVASDRTREAAEPIAQLLEMRPDFPDRGGQLIRRYVKFDDLASRIGDCLTEAGLKFVDGR